MSGINGGEVMETYDPVEDLVHVYPLFGREHVLNGFACWCNPERDLDNPYVVIHNAEQ